MGVAGAMRRFAAPPGTASLAISLGLLLLPVLLACGGVSSGTEGTGGTAGSGAGGGGGASGGNGGSPTCGGCSLPPLCAAQVHDPCSCGCVDGDTMQRNGQTYVCTGGCLSPVSPEAAAPYAACPDVDPAPPATRMLAPPWSDRGQEGLGRLREEVLQSRDAWQRWSAAHGGSYTYRRHFRSFTAEYCDMEVTVEGGRVVALTEWQGGEEEETQRTQILGDAEALHGCFPPVPMEELYDRCLTEVLCQDPRENLLFVAVDARGLLVECGYFPAGCADDCYEGVGPTRISADDSAWNVQPDGCCPIDAAPDCCMDYGGSAASGCGVSCDGMPPPGPAWSAWIDAAGCWQWSEPPMSGTCCGCLPPDAG